ncbi:unnamed protein product [Sphagnum tenellum]
MSLFFLIKTAVKRKKKISYCPTARLRSRCLCFNKNSRAAAAATVYLVYILEVLDNLYEQFRVLFMYLFEAESFGT